jgi:hypothetical protein
MDGYPPYANLVYDVATMMWVRMTQPIVDSVTSSLYLAVDGVEGLLTDIKAQQTTGTQVTRIVGTNHSSGLLEAHVHSVAGHNALTVAFPAPANDAFGRVRVSDPTAIWDSSMEYGSGSLVWESYTTGGATANHSTTSASMKLNVSTTSGSQAIMQTRQYHRYQPGKSQFIAITYTMTTGSTGVFQRVGYFDGQNGIFLELDGTSLYACLRKNGVTQRIAQSAWNVDIFDGNGFSGVLLDYTKAQILIIDLQWLGVGRVRIGFDVDGEFFPAHEFFHANDNVGVYMRTANLPIRYEVTQSGTTAANGLECICNVVLSEGGFEIERGYPFSAASTTGRTVASRRALISIRPKATFNGLPVRAMFLPEDVHVIATGNNVIALVEIVYNPTFTGTPTWASANDESLAEYSVHGDAAAGAITGGIVIHSFFVTASAQDRSPLSLDTFSRLPLSLDIAGLNPRALSLVATDITGAATVYGSIEWREIR